MLFHIIIFLNLIWDIITFIPISFGYEIIFDFFHYITHRFLHLNKFAYVHIHKTHYAITHPQIETTWYHNPLDLLFTNSLPHILTLYFIPSISLFMLNLILIYKVFIEICGHSGKICNSSSFPQCIWIPKILQIELVTEEHDLHHTLNNCNYSKRFKLWDIIFQTYRKY